MARSCPTTRRRRAVSKSSASADFMVGSRTRRVSKQVFATTELRGRPATGDLASLLVMLFLPLGSNECQFHLGPAAYAGRGASNVPSGKRQAMKGVERTQ